MAKRKALVTGKQRNWENSPKLAQEGFQVILCERQERPMN
jgi:hypothetical protein